MSDSENPQRRFQRVPVEMTVRISTIDPEPDPHTGRPFFRASREHCANISEGGAYILTNDPMSPGRRVLVEIELPHGEPIEAVGRVAWSKSILGPEGRIEGSGVGVEFLGDDAEPSSPLQRFLDHYGDNGGQRSRT